MDTEAELFARKQGRPQDRNLALCPPPGRLSGSLAPPSLWVAVRPVQSKQGLKPLALLWRCPWLLHQERQWQGTRAASTERLASCSTRAAPRALPRRRPQNRLR